MYLNPDFLALGPIYAKFEYGVSENIGFGVNIAYADAGINYTNDLGESASFKWWNTSINARVNRHFGSNNKFDPYIGLGMGIPLKEEIRLGKCAVSGPRKENNAPLTNITSNNIAAGRRNFRKISFRSLRSA